MTDTCGTAIEKKQQTAAPETPMRQIWKRLMKQPLAKTSLIICMLFLLSAAGAEIYEIVCDHTGDLRIYEQVQIEERYESPSARHILGTDFLGRDVFLRAFFGAKSAIRVGITACAISALLGVLLGTWAGYKGGRADDLAVWLYSTFASMPTLLFILAFSLLVSKGFLFPPLEKLFAAIASWLRTEPGMLAVYLGIGLTGWVDLCRVVRAETMKLRENQYVQAAQALGCSTFRIIFRHILPNLSHLVIVYVTMRFAYAVMTEVIVSYLGFGAQHEPSWGTMIAQGQGQLWRGIWWEVGGATIFMFILVLALNLLGDALRDATDPKHAER